MPDLFHLSGVDLGDFPLIEPRIPRAPAVGEDATIPRIAVAASVDDCFAGITALKAHGIYHVYRLRGTGQGLDRDIPARLVPDWEKSPEAWLLEPNRFRKIGTVEVLSTSWDTAGCGDVAWRWIPERVALP